MDCFVSAKLAWQLEAVDRVDTTDWPVSRYGAAFTGLADLSQTVVPRGNMVNGELGKDEAFA